MSNAKLTAREREFVVVMGRLAKSMGYPPSVADVGKAMGIGPTRARTLARACELAGLIEHDERTARSWRLVATKK